MSLDTDDVAKIAHLARLAVPNEALAGYAEELSGILSLVEQMNGVETRDVDPMAHPLHMTQRLRDDQPTETDQRSAFQSIAPLTEDGLDLVPRVIE